MIIINNLKATNCGEEGFYLSGRGNTKVIIGNCEVENCGKGVSINHSSDDNKENVSKTKNVFNAINGVNTLCDFFKNIT